MWRKDTGTPRYARGEEISGRFHVVQVLSGSMGGMSTSA